MEHALFIVHRTNPGKRDEVRAVWEKHMAPAIAKNDGHIDYFYCFDHQDHDVLRVFQLYSNAEAADSFLQHPNYAGYLQEVGPLLSNQPEVHTATPQWKKN